MRQSSSSTVCSASARLPSILRSRCFTFSQDFIPVLRNMESKLTAEAPYAKQGSLNGPVKGDQGVFVYKVVKNEKSSTQMTPEQLAQRYSMSMGSAAVSRMAVEILKENKDIVNNLIDFY